MVSIFFRFSSCHVPSFHFLFLHVLSFPFMFLSLCFRFSLIWMFKEPCHEVWEFASGVVSCHDLHHFRFISFHFPFAFRSFSGHFPVLCCSFPSVLVIFLSAMGFPFKLHATCHLMTFRSTKMCPALFLVMFPIIYRSLPFIFFHFSSCSVRFPFAVLFCSCHLSFPFCSFLISFLFSFQRWVSLSSRYWRLRVPFHDVWGHTRIDMDCT